MRVLPYRTIDNVIAGVVITFNDITKITAAEARIDALTVDLKHRIANLAILSDLVPAGVLISEDSQGGTVRLNRYLKQLLGEDLASPSTAVKLRLLEGTQEVGDEDQPIQKAMRSGSAVFAYEGTLLRLDGGHVPVLISATPLLDDAGDVRGGIGVIMDISEQKRSEAQEKALLHELQHRVKNTITTVSALATRMLKGSMSLQEFAPAFTGRLNAMAKTHELLTASNWQGAGLRPLLEATVRSYAARDGGNIAIEGPGLVLAPTAASTLGLVFYELATNAVKYGALKERGGLVSIRWERKGGDRRSDGENWARGGLRDELHPSKHRV